MNTYEDNRRNIFASPYHYSSIYNSRMNRWETNDGVRLAEIHRLQPVRERYNVPTVVKNTSMWGNISGQNNQVRHAQKLHLRASL